MKQVISIAMVLVLLAAGAAVAGSMNSTQAAASGVNAGGGGSSPSPVKRIGATLQRKPHGIDALNNVVTMEPGGSRTALCLCGKTLPVTAGTPSITHDGTMFFLCSTECTTLGERLPEKDWAAVTESWQAKFSATKFPSNAGMREGREMATCLCGKVFEVNSRTLAVAENGLVLHFCGAVCDANARAAAPEGRLQAQLAVLPAAANEPHPSVEVIYRGTDGSWTAASTSVGSEGK